MWLCVFVFLSFVVCGGVGEVAQSVGLCIFFKFVCVVIVYLCFCPLVCVVGLCNFFKNLCGYVYLFLFFAVCDGVV